jgi:hypothetical protein
MGGSRRNISASNVGLGLPKNDGTSWRSGLSETVLGMTDEEEKTLRERVRHFLYFTPVPLSH